MPLQCDVIVDSGVAFEHADKLASLLRHAAAYESLLVVSEWQMTLRLSDDETISELHERFFGDSTPTDVITFPSGDEPSGNEAYLGDVVVSVDTATEQAADAGHSTAREVAFLALHGLLHLCGYDDAAAENRALMHQRQSLLLELWEREWGQPW